MWTGFDPENNIVEGCNGSNYPLCDHGNITGKQTLDIMLLSILKTKENSTSLLTHTHAFMF